MPLGAMMEARLKGVASQILQLPAPMSNPDVTEKQEMATSQQIKQPLLESDFADQVTDDKEALAPHPDNRDGVGLEAIDAHELLEAITNKGWCDDAAAGAAAFEISEGPKKRAAQLAFQADLASCSDGMLAPIEPHKAKYLTAS
ncbi:unnamed protein product, partial [Prorocentrum cordatum]